MNVDAPHPPVTTWTLIEQAQGVIMACYGCDPAAALAILRRVSSSRDVELSALAATVVAAAVDHHGSQRRAAPSPCEQVRLVLRDVPGHQA